MSSSCTAPSSRGAPKWLIVSAIALTLAACGGGGGNAGRPADPALAAQIDEIRPTEPDALVPVFVELGGNPVASAADTALDTDAQRRQLQAQFLADLRTAVTQPAAGASTGNQCDAAALAKRLENRFEPQSGAAVRIELSACELDLLAQLPNVKGVHADIPLDLKASADAHALALEVQRSFDGTGATASIANGDSSAWPTLSGGGKANGAGYVVAVLDTGVEERHPALGAAKVLPGACFSTTTSVSTGLCPNGASVDTVSSTAGRSCADSSAWGGARGNAISAGCFHGTSMAATAAMDYSGVSGKASHGGVAKEAKVLPIQAFSKSIGSNGISSSSSDLLAAIEWLTARADTLKANGTPVVALNMSLGGGSYTSACDNMYVGSLFKTAFANLRAKGIVPVAAAGNSGIRNAISFPACVSNTLSVAAAKLNYSGVASYSNFSSQVKLFAPGGDLVEGMYAMPTLCASSGAYDCWSQNAGTSPATAFVSGAVAALRTAAPKASLSEIESALTTDLSTVYPSLAKQITEPNSALKRPALRVTASAYKLLNLPDPQPNPTPVKYTIGGNVTGLASGASVTLLNNGGDALTVQTNGSFAFKTPIAANTAYKVTVSVQPTNQTCTVGNASGTATANISNVGVTCSDNNTGGGPKLSFKELCVYSNPNYTGSTACAWWNGRDNNIYGYFGAVRSVSVRNITVDLTNFKIDRSAPPISTEGSFVLRLTPFSSRNVVTLKTSSPNVSALLPSNALVRQVEIKSP